VIPYLVVFAASLAATFATTPAVRRLSLRLGWIDRPSDRKVHPAPTPTAGGLAIFVGVAAGLGLSRVSPFLSGLHRTSSDPDAALVAGLVVVALGILDDARGVSPLGKLVGQVLAAGLLVLIGVQLLYFYFPGQGILVLSPDLSVTLTVLWVLAMVNAVNLIDGLDGLAAGMVAIGAIAFFAYMFRVAGGGTEPSTAALLSAVVAGSALGFLPWNFHPARIFMGDSGAMLLGLMMAVATISGVGRSTQVRGGDFAAVAIPILVPLLVLAVPILDVVLAIARRMRRGVRIMHADKQHIHHRLLEIGHTHRNTVLLMYLWSALISTCSLAVAFINGRIVVLAIVVVAVTLAAVVPVLLRNRGGRGDRPVRVDHRLHLSRNGRRARAVVPGPPVDVADGSGSPLPDQSVSETDQRA
jgi:UDP-GlcNAc:undecaprenyl-phosphate/decaprenyl-phosphate GlcNAc-1-phosphate transferase